MHELRSDIWTSEISGKHSNHARARRRSRFRRLLGLLAFIALTALFVWFFYAFSRPTSASLEKQAIANSPEPELDMQPLNEILVIYVYNETPDHRANFEFFLKYGLHAEADFKIVLHGESKVKLPRDYPNVEYILLPNECYDLGRYQTVVQSLGLDAKYQYKKFIFMNGSVRGPFLPWYSDQCWTDIFADKVTAKNKLVGTTVNCQEFAPHLQSMIFATDRIGYNTIRPALQCYTDKGDAILEGELSITQRIRDANYTVDALLLAAHGNGGDTTAYLDHCPYGNVNQKHGLEGLDVHPFDVVFIKYNWDVDRRIVDRYSRWVKDSGYTSWTRCRHAAQKRRRLLERGSGGTWNGEYS